jgi:hypothetical protein
MFIGLAVWVTAHVTLVVLFVLLGVFAANTHVLIRDLPAPGDHHIVDVDGVMPRPEHPLGNPQETAFNGEGFDEAFDMPDGKACDGSETLKGNPGALAKHVGFGEDGIEDNALRAGNLDTAENSL